MPQCGCKDPLSGAICTLDDEHGVQQHKDESDPGTVIIFGDPPKPIHTPTPAEGTPTAAQQWAALYQIHTNS